MNLGGTGYGSRYGAPSVSTKPVTLAYDPGVVVVHPDDADEVRAAPRIGAVVDRVHADGDEEVARRVRVRRVTRAVPVRVVRERVRALRERLVAVGPQVAVRVDLPQIRREAVGAEVHLLGVVQAVRVRVRAVRQRVKRHLGLEVLD